VIVLDAKMTPVVKRTDRHGMAITCIKFSPNDLVLAVGANDMVVTIHDVNNKF
jgi:WD40 repeat protein